MVFFFFQEWNWFLLLVPYQVFLSMERFILSPDLCLWRALYLSTAQNVFHSPPDLFYCPGALQCHASAPVKSVCTERTQVIKITDWSAFSQIGFDPKPWNDFWAFVNLALKLKWFGQHDSVWWIIYQSGSANCLRRKSVDFMEERLASVTYNRLWGFEWFGFTNT